MNPDQLETLVGRFREAVVAQPIEVEHGEPWSLEDAGDVLDKLTGLYSADPPDFTPGGQ